MLVREKLQHWIEANIETEGFSRFEDLHLDELESDYTSPDTWIVAINDVVEALNEIRNKIPAGFCASIGVSLLASDSPLGITFHDSKQLSKEFTVTPPSVYIFKKGDEPWVQRPADAKQLPSEILSDCTVNVQLIYLEYREMYESQYRRSFWVVC